MGGIVVGVFCGSPPGDVERLLELTHGILGVTELLEHHPHLHVGIEHRRLDARRPLRLLGDRLQSLHGGLEEIALDLLRAGGLIELGLHLVDQDLHGVEGQSGLTGGDLGILLGDLLG